MINSQQLLNIQPTPRHTGADSALSSILTQLISAAYPEDSQEQRQTLKRNILKKRQWRRFLSTYINYNGDNPKGVISLNMIDHELTEMDELFMIELALGEPEATSLATIESDLDLVFVSTMVSARVFNCSADHVRSVGLHGLSDQLVGVREADLVQRLTDNPFTGSEVSGLGNLLACQKFCELIDLGNEGDEWNVRVLPQTDASDRSVLVKDVPPYLVGPIAAAAATEASTKTGLDIYYTFHRSEAIVTFDVRSTTNA